MREDMGGLVNWAEKCTEKPEMCKVMHLKRCNKEMIKTT